MKTHVMIWLCLWAFVLGTLGTSSFFDAGQAHAKAEIVTVKGAAFNASASIRDNLIMLKGQRVSLLLKSGGTVGGIVKIIGPHMVHVEKLDRKDFFDALVQIDDICAIETRFREYKRK